MKALYYLLPFFSKSFYKINSQERVHPVVYSASGTLPIPHFKSQAFDQPYKCQPLHVIMGACESDHQQLRNFQLLLILNPLASWKDLLALP